MKPSIRDFNRRILPAGIILAGLAVLLFSAPAVTAPGKISREVFRAPPVEYRPWVRWWWPGNDVEEAEIRREIGVMDSAGIGGAEIQAFTCGLDPKALAEVQDRVLSFGSPSYYRHLLAAVEEADRRGMRIDVTLGSGWPFGGSHITRDLGLRTLLWNEVDVRGNKTVEIKIPPPKKPVFFTVAGVIERLLHMQIATFFQDDFRPIAAVAARPVGKSRHSRKPWNFKDTVMLDVDTIIDLTPMMGADGVIRWQAPEGRWKVVIFYVGPNGTAPTLVAEKDPGLTVDHWSRDAVLVHARRVMGPGDDLLSRYYGGALRGFFTDSLELKVEQFWSDDFLAEFEKRRGYDLTPFLPAVPVPMKNNMIGHLGFDPRPEFDFAGGEGERIRYDVDRTVSELYGERFIRTLSDFAESKGIYSRLQAHGMQVDILKNYGASHIPETEQLYAGGSSHFLKMASSAGHLYGRNLVTSESVVWDGRDYLTTPLKIKAAADKLFTAGINGFIYHGFPYTYERPEFGTPSWDPFSSPAFPLGTFSSNVNEQSPFFKYLPTLNAYITRCQYILRQGKNVADLAMYYPWFGYPQRTLVREELTGGVLDDTDAPLASGGLLNKVINREMTLWPEHQWVIDSVRVTDPLAASGYTYDHVNEDCLMRAKVEGGRIRLCEASYRALVFNRTVRLPLPVMEKIEELAKRGAAIVFVGELPEEQPGFKDYETNGEKIRAIASRLTRLDNVILVGEDYDVAEAIERELQIEPGLEEDGGQGVPDYVHRSMPGADFFFIRNDSRTPLSLSIGFPCPGRMPEIWNPWTGGVVEANAYHQKGKRVFVEIDLPAYGSAMVGFEKPLKAGASKQPEPDLKKNLPAPIQVNNWRLETSILSAKGKEKPVDMDLAALADWRETPKLKGCSTPGRYTAVVEIGAEFIEGAEGISLDLGDVRDAAEVMVNGKDACTLLVPPFLCDISGLVEPGDNTIEVVVTPTLYNRLVRWGDSGDKRYAQFKGRTNRAPSGLLGPVEIRALP